MATIYLLISTRTSDYNGHQRTVTHGAYSTLDRAVEYMDRNYPSATRLENRIVPQWDGETIGSGNWIIRIHFHIRTLLIDDPNMIVLGAGQHDT